MLDIITITETQFDAVVLLGENGPQQVSKRMSQHIATKLVAAGIARKLGPRYSIVTAGLITEYELTTAGREAFDDLG